MTAVSKSRIACRRSARSTPIDADIQDAAARLLDIASSAAKFVDTLSAAAPGACETRAGGWQPDADPIAAELAERARGIKDEINKSVDAAAERDRSAAQARWRDWLLKNVDGGGA